MQLVLSSSFLFLFLKLLVLIFLFLRPRGPLNKPCQKLAWIGAVFKQVTLWKYGSVPQLDSTFPTARLVFMVLVSNR